jgi:ubiquinone/menaquinone biosynthesis C-methylase UbiE
VSDGKVTTPVDATNSHYAPLFSRFKAELGDGSLQFETECLAYELNQIDDIPEAGLVLDAGCGTGRYAAAWRKLFPSATLVGVDINRVILQRGLVTDTLSPINGNLEALPFKSGSFDVVMSRGALPATFDPRQAVRELLRVCKPGGLFYFYTYRYGMYDVVLKPFRILARAVGAPLCSRVIYAVRRLLRLDPRVPTMILDELFAPIRNSPSAKTVLEWLDSSGVPLAATRPIVHAQYGSIHLPVDRRTAFLYRILPKIGVISLAVRTAER